MGPRDPRYGSGLWAAIQLFSHILGHFCQKLKENGSNTENSSNLNSTLGRTKTHKNISEPQVGRSWNNGFFLTGYLEMSLFFLMFFYTVKNNNQNLVYFHTKKRTRHNHTNFATEYKNSCINVLNFV
jgi:hypothetical protein